jgi:hypothetical protein
LVFCRITPEVDIAKIRFVRGRFAILRRPRFAVAAHAFFGAVAEHLVVAILVGQAIDTGVGIGIMQ